MKKFQKKLKKYFGSLFDFSFKDFITLSVLRVIYWVEVVLGALLVALAIIEGFRTSILLGLIALIISPIIFFVYLVVWRVILETIAVVFRIAEGVKQISEFWKEAEEASDKIKVEKYEVEERVEKTENEE